MKPQDILFILILIVLLFKRNPKYFVWAGLVSILLSIPLFAFWVFFTAQRFVYYGVAFMLFACVFFILDFRNK
ncbi:MAG TPA: hypothetical protein VHE53_00255 [Patescibacteria group bacterium]|nr:hypothetical protein [Patescibacteria group bacterium]